jgi:hypothetical protein
VLLTRDETFRVVFNVRTPCDGEEKVGSGIFVAKSDSEGYLLTAAHVAKDCASSTMIVISDASGQAHTISLQKFNPTMSWRVHPAADLACLEVTPSEDIANLLTGRFFPFSQFHGQATSVSRDDELTAVGFPHGFGATGLFSPLTYRSFASSSLITLQRFDNRKPADFFLLENPSVGGYSGCPVFDLGYRIVGAMTTHTGRPTTCFGIMHGTISDVTGGKLAAVTPSHYLQNWL